MRSKKIDLLEILFWILIIVLFIMILSRIFGSSATDIQIYIAFFTSLLVIMGYIVKLNRELVELKIKTINSFDNMKNDIDLIKKKLKI